ncbi:MAG TPA: response regulator [Candidatus Saccharimonadales bacterium]|nr:response regulator [Candidatus Saccharimonadales bacterium]
MAKKILIVEDDKVLAETLQAILTDTGLYEIAQANDGDTGAKLADEFGPDLIILDLLMAGTTGMDLLKKWQESGLSKHVPVIVATNVDQLQLMNHALNMGVHNYFLKSEMSPEAIVSHCAKVLAEAEHPETLQMPPDAPAPAA